MVGFRSSKMERSGCPSRHLKQSMRTASAPDKRNVSHCPVVYGSLSIGFCYRKQRSTIAVFLGEVLLRNHEFLREGYVLKERGVQACNATSFRICNSESLRDSELSDCPYKPTSSHLVLHLSFVESTLVLSTHVLL